MEEHHAYGSCETECECLLKPVWIIRTFSLFGFYSEIFDILQTILNDFRSGMALSSQNLEVLVFIIFQEILVDFLGVDGSVVDVSPLRSRQDHERVSSI